MLHRPHLKARAERNLHHDVLLRMAWEGRGEERGVIRRGCGGVMHAGRENLSAVMHAGCGA